MIDFAKKAIEERNKKKVNVVFVSPDSGNSPAEKAWCEICRQYMRFIGDATWLCTSCETEKTQEGKDADRLENTFKSSPTIAHARKKKHDRSDFPKGAHIKEDIEYSSSGERRERILDNRDV